MQFARPDANQWKALARLVRSQEGEVLLSLLDTELQALQGHMLDASGDYIWKLQGASKSMSTLTKLLRQAPELADKAR